MDRFQPSLAHVASNTKLLQYVQKSLPCVDLDLFYGKVNVGGLYIRMVKTVRLSFEGTIAGNIYDSRLLYLYMTITFKHVYWYISYQISGVLIQDHWPSGCTMYKQSFLWQFS